MLKGHGDDIYDHNVKVVSNFSSNINMQQDLSALQAHLCEHINSIHSYPEPDSHSLVELLAYKYQVSEENICVTSGATEAIYLIAQAFRGRKTAIIIPTFSEYEDACTMNEHQLQFYRRLEDIDSNTQLVWLCNPNNPNGYVYNKKLLTGIVKAQTKTCFVFDQSYEHFTDKSLLSIVEALELDNVILLHSMTKYEAIPGLRLGYITAHSKLIQKINKFRMPWSVNQLAIEAGKFLMNKAVRDSNMEELLQESQRLWTELSKLKGLFIYPTNTQFFLCKLDKKKASDLKEYLVCNHGILIRDASNFRGLDGHHFRIATQSRTENDFLVKVIKEWL